MVITMSNVVNTLSVAFEISNRRTRQTELEWVDLIVDGAKSKNAAAVERGYVTEDGRFNMEAIKADEPQFCSALSEVVGANEELAELVQLLGTQLGFEGEVTPIDLTSFTSGRIKSGFRMSRRQPKATSTIDALRAAILG